jgi:hypothetical protein
MQWFAMLPDRKNRSGTAKLFKKKHAWPRCSSFPASYILEEKETLAKLRKRLQDSPLVVSDNHDEVNISANSRQSRRRIKANSSTLTKTRERRTDKRNK